MTGIFMVSPALAAMVLMMATIWGSFDQVAAGDVSPVEYNSGIAEGNRQLTDDSTCNDDDDALDLTRPEERADLVFDARLEAIEREKQGTGTVCQINSGETDLAGKFHKSLPHDDLGQVDEEAFAALEECIASGDFDVCEAVPAGDEDGFLVNPVAGFSIPLAGPAATALSIPPAPTLDSAELAAQLAEDYWMALARDVPFSRYGRDEITTTAAGMEGFSGVFGVAMNNDGSIDPLSQLFRVNFTGVQTGPMISQLLVNDFTFDSLTISPFHTVFASGVDYMTDYDEWLRIQNGGAPGQEEEDSRERFIRNARDLATIAGRDTIYTEAFRGAFVLMEQDAISRPGFNGPYIESTRQVGFVTYGISNVMRLLGAAEVTMVASWYQKWQVHNLARPEALAGTVHNTLLGFLDAPIHPSLLENSELLDRVAASNAAQNDDGSETFLLSQASMAGSPTHPAYPGGHSVQNGAFAAVLKAFVGLERGARCFENPRVPNDSGLRLLDYNGDCLTIEGEINKLATNVAIGRQMLGVHYRIDSTEGLVLGETAGIRLLHQELMSYPEENTFKFRLFTGEVIELFFDGTFAIDGRTCSGEVYEGVAAC